EVSGGVFDSGYPATNGQSALIVGSWSEIDQAPGQGTARISGGDLNFRVIAVGVNGTRENDGGGTPTLDGRTTNGVVEQTGGKILTAELQLAGNNPSNRASYTISGNSVLNIDNVLWAGREGAQGTLTQNGGTITAGWVEIGSNTLPGNSN